jgi:hypothetical protein
VRKIRPRRQRYTPATRQGGRLKAVAESASRSACWRTESSNFPRGYAL